MTDTGTPQLDRASSAFGRARGIDPIAHDDRRTVLRGVLPGSGAVAIKVYAPSAIDRTIRARIARELEAQTLVHDPHVAPLVEWGELDDGAIFVTSAWIEGETLESILARGPIPWSHAAPMVLALARGLGAIHAHRIVHRDVKPSNVVIPRDAAPPAVLLDLGHVLVPRDERVTDRGMVVGTAAYMAPEQAAGGTLDGRADLYALGVVLYRCLTGSLPFESQSAAELLSMHQHSMLEPPRERARRRGLDATAVSEEAEHLCLWLLAKSLEERLPSARVLELTLRATDALSAERT
jgi:serine/threonine protein kinase